MKLICDETGRKTTLADLEEETLQRAVDRIIRREAPGHYGQLNRTSAGNMARRSDTHQGYKEGWAHGAVRHVEVVRSVGSLTEHTRKFVNFTIEN